MTGTMRTITVDGRDTSVCITAAPQCEELQHAVGGYIEVVPYFDQIGGEPCVVFCNEEGKLEGLAVNRAAQALWKTAQGANSIDDVLVGDIVIITGADILPLL